MATLPARKSREGERKMEKDGLDKERKRDSGKRVYRRRERESERGLI